MKSNSEAVKRWKEANRERSRELNRKSYQKCKKAKILAKLIKPDAKLRACACGNKVMSNSINEVICDRCKHCWKLYRKNREDKRERFYSELDYSNFSLSMNP